MNKPKEGFDFLIHLCADRTKRGRTVNRQCALSLCDEETKERLRLCRFARRELNPRERGFWSALGLRSCGAFRSAFGWRWRNALSASADVDSELVPVVRGDEENRRDKQR